MSKSKEELIELLRQNIKSFNNYRKESNYEKLDLSGADLSVANLCRADLTNCILTNSDLSYSYLHSAILKDCVMTKLVFGRADMTEADLTGSNLNGADLNNTILYGSNLTRIIGKNLTLEGAKVREANFTSANLENAILRNLDLNGVNFDKANLKGANLIGSNLTNSINLHTSVFNDNTVWPDPTGLPSNFDPSNITPETHDEPEEDTSDLNIEFGPGISSTTQDYQFLDMQPPKEEEEEEFISFDSTSTEFSASFNDKSFPKEVELDELPNFEQFSIDQFEEFPEAKVKQAEPGFAISDSDLVEELPSLTENKIDEIDQDFESSFQDLTQFENGKLPKSSITQVDFTVQPDTLASNLMPNPNLLNDSDAAALPSLSHAISMPAESLKPVIELLQSISGRLETLENEQKEQKKIIVTIKNKIDEKQSISGDIINKIEEKQNAFKDTLNKINQKQLPADFINIIEEKQNTLKDILNKIDKNQLSVIETINSQFEQKPDQEIVSKKLEDVTALAKKQFSRLESKMDIIAQTDSLSQIDTLLGEFTDYVQEEHENLGTKVNDLITITESVVALLENSAAASQEIDLSQVTSELHLMLTNLESNIREDQEKTEQIIETATTNLEYSFKENQERVEQKVDDLSTNLDGFSLILETIQSEVSQINNNAAPLPDMGNIEERISNISEGVSNVSENISDISKGISGVNENISDISKDILGVNENISDISKDILGVNENISDISKGISGVNENISDISKDISGVNENISDISKGILGVNENITNINELSTNINDSIKKLLELKDNETTESQVFEALYDFEFRIRLELEKNESTLSSMENSFNNALEKLDSAIKKPELQENTLNSATLTELLDNFRNIITSEMKSIDNKSVELKALGEDIIYNIKISLNDNISSMKEALEHHLINLNDKIDGMSTTPKTLNELKQSLEYLVERDINTENSLNSINNMHASLRKEFKAIIEHISHLNAANHNINNKISAVGNQTNSMDNKILHINKLMTIVDKKIDQFRNEPKIDDELRSIFEHLLGQLSEYAQISKENTEKLSRKLDAQESELHSTIKELDRRVSKINSMIRNIYKGLDSLIDLVTGTTSPSIRSLSSVQERSRRDLIPRSKDYEDDIDID